MPRSLIALISLSLLAFSGCKSARRPVSEPAPAKSVESTPVAPRAPYESTGGVDLAEIAPPVRRDALLLASRLEPSVDRLIRHGEAAADAVALLLNSKNLDELAGALRYAAELHPDALRKGVVALLAHDAARIRRLAIAALRAFEARGDAAALASLLADPDPAVRADAAEALRLVGDAGAMEALIARVQDPDPEVAFEAAHAAAHLGGEAAVAPLVAEARTGPPQVRRAALHALRRESRAVPLSVLNDALLSDDPALVQEAVAGLGLAVEDEAPIRLGRLMGDGRPAVRRRALEVVWTTDSKAGHMAATHMLTDAAPDVRATAIDLLASAETPAVDAATLKAALASDHPGLRATAATWAWRVPDPDLRAQILALAQSGDDLSLRRVAARSLGRSTRLEDLGSLEALVALLEEPRAPVGEDAADALERVTGQDLGEDPAAWRTWLAARQGEARPAGAEVEAP